MALKVAVSSTQKKLKENEKKWGAPLMAAGFSMIPTMIFQKQNALGLKANDINVLMHLITHWWFADRLPYPSIKEIARRMGVDRSTVQRCITSMVDRKLIIRNARKSPYGQTTNSYDMSGLIGKATVHAKKFLEDKKKRKKEPFGVVSPNDD